MRFAIIQSIRLDRGPWPPGAVPADPGERGVLVRDGAQHEGDHRGVAA